MNVRDLPQVIAASLTTKFPAGTLRKAERITRGSAVSYEVLIENGEDNLEVLLDPNGVVKGQTLVDDMDDETDVGEHVEDDED